VTGPEMAATGVCPSVGLGVEVAMGAGGVIVEPDLGL